MASSSSFEIDAIVPAEEPPRIGRSALSLAARMPIPG